ncbi:MAG: hypothetical protein KGL35_10645 [Bradyrhizobium sp.]|nr:hypothetical protein [Bradyrhizobium sp.]
MKRLGLALIFPIIALGLLFTALRYLTCIFTNPEKGWHIAYMVDEACNVDANGRVNWTISARAANARNRGQAWGCILCRILGWIQPGHCDTALKDEAATILPTPPAA